MNRCLAAVAIAAAALAFAATSATAQQPLTIKPLAEKKVAELPSGTLYWRIENVASLADAQAAAGQWGLAAESKGKVWLFTLGAAGGSTGAGSALRAAVEAMGGDCGWRVAAGSRHLYGPGM